MHDKSLEQVYKELQSTPKGLADKEVQRRQEKYGKNILQKEKGISKTKIILNQVTNYIVYILLIAALISLFLEEYIDTIVILAIVLLNTLLGFFQEYKAEKALKALEAYTKPQVKVVRNGKQIILSSEELVPGDIIIIEEGTHITADARLITIASLQVDESLLTGESVSVIKEEKVLTTKTILANRVNMIFAGTTATTGRAIAMAIATGAHTELGKIAKEIQTAPQKETPLQKKLRYLGVQMTYGILLLCAVIFAINLFRGEPLETAILVTIALIVAAVPEGLPAVVTICLSLGTQRLVKKNALIRRLPAVETLGSVTVICSDKTGTLTQNKMTVKEIYTSQRSLEVEGAKITSEKKKVEPQAYTLVSEIATLCNNATETTGDPTEIALKILAKEVNIIPKEERLKEIPFTSEKKYMATINKREKETHYLTKGATEVIINKCIYEIKDNKEIKINREKIQKKAEEMAQRGLRVLACAYSKTGQDKNLIFAGLIGMRDPPRPEVEKAIEACNRAGIKVIMITGDHLLTAQSIAQEIGVTGKAVSGQELEDMSAEELRQNINDIGIVARVSPSQKVKILEALKGHNHIVAMTGDGVNDAPALKRADIGVAVGSGTDVAKEAADMVLLDDNFATLVKAIEEGRSIFENIKKFIQYLFASNLGELLTIFLGLIINLPLPILAIQILWMNLVTDGLPALALGVDPAEADALKRPPRNPKEGIVTKQELGLVVATGIGMALLTLALFSNALKVSTLAYAQTITFTTLVILQMVNAINYHSLNKHIWQKKNFNIYLGGAIALSIGLQIVMVYSAQGLLQTQAISLGNWIGIGIVSLSMIAIKEIFETGRKVTSYKGKNIEILNK